MKGTDPGTVPLLDVGFCDVGIDGDQVTIALRHKTNRFTVGIRGDFLLDKRLAED